MEKDIPQQQSPKETQCNHTNITQNRVKVKKNLPETKNEIIY